MPADYIARISGTAGNYSIIDWMTGSLADAPAGETGWVEVNRAWPILDNATQIQTKPIRSVSSDGQSANWTLEVENLDPLDARENLRQLATKLSIAKANGGMVAGGMSLATDSAKSGEIVDAIEAIERGWAPDPYPPIQMLDGSWQSLSKAQLEAAGQAITQFRLANYAARKACLDGINAGTITTTAEVLAAI